MRAVLLVLGLLAMLQAPAAAVAALHPVPGEKDPRIQTVEFDPDQVVELQGRLGYEMMVEFGPDERIENVAIGDAAAWQVTPNRRANLLFIKPLPPGTPTNMTVVTDVRRYAFELTPGAGGAAPTPHILRFRYAAAPTASAASRTPPVRNVDYAVKGARMLRPAEVFDDGRFTYFRWRDEAGVPAIFVLTDEGAENLANTAVRGGYVIVEQLSRRFVLRSGEEQAIVTNRPLEAARGRR